jgi:di/tripeptidase
MSFILYHLNISYEARDLDEENMRERLEQALNIACSSLEDYKDTKYISYKIRETSILD